MVSKAFRNYVWFVLINIFLVIIAGSVVRTTQSGMGCPDWPTCFGNLIPPTEMKQVVFQPNHAYKKGQFIIYNDSLKYAAQKFVSGSNYNPANWKQYEKHNHAKFNVSNTWIEYINRLLGVLLGIWVLILFGWSFKFFKLNKSIVALSFGLILLTVFQAWLGKTVVDSNLALLKITLHMFGALAMLFLCQYILFLAKNKRTINADKKIVWLNVLLFVITFIQIVLGTNVRGQIDTISDKIIPLNRSGWVEQLNFYFYIHRSFSLAIAALAVYLFFATKYKPKTSALFLKTIGVIVLEIVVGIVLTYVNFPAIAQPIHLLVSSILIAVIFNNWLRLKSFRK